MFNWMVEIRYREIKPGQIRWKREQFSPEFVPNIASRIENVFEIGQLYEFQLRIVFPSSPAQNQQWSDEVFRAFRDPEGLVHVSRVPYNN